MIIGIGIDLLYLPRLQSLVARRGINKLAQRILHPAELMTFRALPPSLDCSPSSLQLSFLSTRWTIKEAAYKAYFPRRRLTWKQVLVNKQEGKKPNLEFWKDEVMELGFKSFVSVSHDGDYVIAQVILEEMS